MASILDVRNILKTHRKQKAGDVFDLARRLANNESFDPEDILAAVTASGVTDDELADLVDMVRRRVELRARAATAQAAEKELAQARDGIRRQREALDEAERRYRRAVEPLLEQEARAEERVREATIASSALLSNTNLPTVFVERVEQAKQQLHDASRAVQEIEDTIRRQTERAETAAERLEGDGGFDRRNGQYLDPDRRQTLTLEQIELVEAVRGGRHQAAEATKKLEQAQAVHATAMAALQDAERQAREF